VLYQDMVDTLSVRTSFTGWTLRHALEGVPDHEFEA
jgi:hypothetical protein